MLVNRTGILGFHNELRFIRILQSKINKTIFWLPFVAAERVANVDVGQEVQLVIR